MRRVTPEEMREIQLRMLNIFADFCEEHNLRYSLGGGTLLGAVRHKGFIPWDDDIDVMMPRPDYEYFLKNFDGRETNTKLSYYLHDKDHINLFAKLYDNRTSTLERCSEDAVFIDIFPIDFFPNKELANSALSVISKLKLYNFRVKNHRDVPLINIIWRRLYWEYELIKEHHFDLWNYSHTAMYKKLCSFITLSSIDEAQFGGAVLGEYGEKEVMSATVFLNYFKMPFEGKEYMCIQDYDAYLIQHYGDYMQLPPMDERKPSHGTSAYWI